jgi:hypothetical protein
VIGNKTGISPRAFEPKTRTTTGKTLLPSSLFGGGLNHWNGGVTAGAELFDFCRIVANADKTVAS